MPGVRSVFWQIHRDDAILVIRLHAVRVDVLRNRDRPAKRPIRTFREHVAVLTALVRLFFLPLKCQNALAERRLHIRQSNPRNLCPNHHFVRLVYDLTGRYLRKGKRSLGTLRKTGKR